MISFLVAMDQNRVIGYQNDLPWRLPNDLKFFKEKSTGNTIIMGRKTYESMGRPLPNRKNVVLTRQENYQFPEEVEVINTIQTVLDWNEKKPAQEFIVIGGATIFEQFLAFADRMYITYIDEVFKGDTYFPEFPTENWEITAKEKGVKNEKNPYDYYFMQYDRKQ